MTRILVAVLGIFLASTIGIRAFQAPTTDVTTARVSADSWLALVDKQNYAGSWDEAASGFKALVTKERWQAAVSTAREPLGSVKSRTLKSATATTTLPGAPAGEYVVFQFDTAFEQRPTAAETLTTGREKDGTWRVVGYFVK